MQWTTPIHSQCTSCIPPRTPLHPAKRRNSSWISLSPSFRRDTILRSSGPCRTFPGMLSSKNRPSNSMPMYTRNPASVPTLLAFQETDPDTPDSCPSIRSTPATRNWPRRITSGSYALRFRSIVCSHQECVVYTERNAQSQAEFRFPVRGAHALLFGGGYPPHSRASSLQARQLALTRSVRRRSSLIRYAIMATCVASSTSVSCPGTASSRQNSHSRISRHRLVQTFHTCSEIPVHRLESRSLGRTGHRLRPQTSRLRRRRAGGLFGTISACAITCALLVHSLGRSIQASDPETRCSARSGEHDRIQHALTILVIRVALSRSGQADSTCALLMRYLCTTCALLGHLLGHRSCGPLGRPFSTIAHRLWLVAVCW